MFVGDSITEGCGSTVGICFRTASFRRPLWKMLSTQRMTTAFVGPRTRKPSGAHAVGRLRFGARCLLGSHAQQLASNETHVQHLVETYRPDIVFILLGANDLAKYHYQLWKVDAALTGDGEARSAALAAAAIEDTIADLRSVTAMFLRHFRSDDSYVIVSSLLPTSQPHANLVELFNKHLHAQFDRRGHDASASTAVPSRFVEGVLSPPSLQCRCQREPRRGDIVCFLARSICKLG